MARLPKLSEEQWEWFGMIAWVGGAAGMFALVYILAVVYKIPPPF